MKQKKGTFGGSWKSIFVGATLGLLGLLLHQARQRQYALAARKGKVTDRAVERLGVPVSALHLPVNDLQLHAVLAGAADAPLLVLLHGFPECWYAWRHQIPLLVEMGYRVLALDQRGYNLSDKPAGIYNYRVDCLTSDIREAILALGYQDAVVVGHDWGGVVAWRFAMDYADMVKQLVIMNAPHPAAYQRELRRGWKQRLKSWYILFFQLPWLPEAVLSLAAKASVRRFFRDMAVRPQAFSEADLEVLAVALSQPGAMHAALHWYRAALRYPALNAEQYISAPTLLIWGEDDVALSKDLTYDLVQWVPQLKTHYVAHCGHWVQSEASDEVNAHLANFLDLARP